MASTNKTTNYELSQYIGTDKPTYLTDYNQDMSKIDAGIHAAKSEADTNADSIGTLSSLTTSAKSNLVAAINEVDADVTTNTNNISTNTSNIATNTAAIGTLANLTTTSKTDLVVAANEINSKVGNLSQLTTPIKSSTVGAINSLKELFFLNDIDNCTCTVSAGTIENPIVTCAKNADGSIFKLYGRIICYGQSTFSTAVITITNTGLPPVDSEYTISGAGVRYSSGGTATFIPVDLTYKTNGDMAITFTTGDNSTHRFVLIACLYFNSDFGDEPEQ